MKTYRFILVLVIGLFLGYGVSEARNQTGWDHEVRLREALRNGDDATVVELLEGYLRHRGGEVVLAPTPGGQLWSHVTNDVDHEREGLMDQFLLRRLGATKMAEVKERLKTGHSVRLNLEDFGE